MNPCIKTFLNKLFIQRNLNFIVPNFVVPYLGRTLLDLRTKVRRTIEEKYHKLKVIFRSTYRLNSLFRFKDSFEKNNPLWSNLSLNV